MAKRTYQDKLDNIKTWCEITDYYWQVYQGQLRNQEDFWADTLHSMRDQDWWDWVDIEPSIKIQYEEHYRNYPKLAEDTKDIERRLMLGKPVVKPHRKGGNHTAFRGWMAIKDLINDIQGTPTRKFTEPSTDEPIDQFEALFDV